MERTHRWFLVVFLLLFWYVPFLEGAEIAEEKPHPHVALVLSGGGAKGFAHIPIIEAIERAGIPIDMVIGTSMGSLVGGLYAAGYSPSDMYDLLEQYNMVELFAMTAVQRPKPIPQPLEKRRDNLFFIAFDEGGLGNTSGIIADQRILRVLNDALSRVVGIADFDKLVIPFRCVGADLVTGERVVFSSGSLVDAIRGSISIPLVFPPYPIGNQFIIDGGLVDNLPINLARSMGADIVIAVNVNAADYEISAEELSSLTAVLDHMLTLVTKNTLVGQLDNADLLVLPHLADIEMLDFTKVDEIIQIGKKEAKAYADDFALLAEKIAEKRPLVYRDPQRIGSYFSFPEVFIASVSHRALPGSPVADEPFDLTPFAEFIGYPLDEGRKKELYALCDAVRAQGTYATITYTITEPKAGPDGMVAGNLEIQTRAFEPKKGSFSIGAFGTASLNYDGQTGFETACYPAFSFTFAYESFLDSPFHFTMQAVNDIAFQLRTALRYPMGKFFFAEADAIFATGALQIASQERVFLLSPLMAVSFQKKNETLVRLSFYADFLWYSSNTVDDTLIPTVSLEAVYGNLPFGFFAPSGLRLDGSISCAWEEDAVGVRFEGRAQYAVGVSQRDTIALDVHAGGSRFTNMIRKNYLDYGGSDGMSSYPVHAMTDEMIIARAKYSRQISDNIVDSYLQALLAVGWRGPLITDPPYSNPHPLFGSLGSTEVAASLAFGLSTQFGDILVGLAGDTSRRFSLFVEVL